VRAEEVARESAFERARMRLASTTVGQPGADKGGGGAGDASRPVRVPGAPVPPALVFKCP